MDARIDGRDSRAGEASSLLTDKPVVIRRAARRDMVRYFGWLETEAGTDTAERFMAAADHTFAKLAPSPQIGLSIESHNVNLAGVRKWRIDGFGNMLVFYSPRANGVLILRVLHSSQDWWTILGLDDQP